MDAIESELLAHRVDLFAEHADVPFDVARVIRVAAADLSRARRCLGPDRCPDPLWKLLGVLHMATPIADGTDVWVVVPASPPLRLTIRACLHDHCRECGLPVYRCESEGGQMLSLCAGHLRLRN